MARLSEIFGGETVLRFKDISRQKRNYTVKLKTTSNNHYDFQAWRWALHIVRRMGQSNMLDRDIYIVSSNLHALSNLLAGYPRQIKTELRRYSKKIKLPTGAAKLDKEDKRYLLLKEYLGDNSYTKRMHKRHHDSKCGIRFLKDFTLEHLEAQAIDLERLDRKFIDPRIKKIVKKNKNAAILNIDYPFGDEAYYACKHLLAILGEKVKGIYIMGKAGALVGDVGDIVIPDEVYDETSNLNFNINNAVKKHAHGMKKVNVHKDISVAAVHGTILSTKETLRAFKAQNIVTVEMESGPFMKAIYDHYIERHVYSSADVDLTGVPPKIGIVYYVSDIPLNPEKTLGAGHIPIKGFHSTYQAAIATLESIFEQ